MLAWPKPSELYMQPFKNKFSARILLRVKLCESLRGSTCVRQKKLLLHGTQTVKKITSVLIFVWVELSESKSIK